VFYHVSWKDGPPSKRQRISKNPKQPTSPPVSLTPSPTSPFPFQDVFQFQQQQQLFQQQQMVQQQQLFQQQQVVQQQQVQPQQEMVQPLSPVQHQIVVQSYPQQRPQQEEEMEWNLTNLIEDEDAVNLIKDEDTINLLSKLQNKIKDKSFLITDVLEKMGSESKFSMTPSDYNNFKILMTSESQQNERITMKQFNSFLSRFGPLTKCLPKIRDFVNSGAVHWFHGNINREKSVELLKNSFNKEKCTHYLLRSVPTHEGVFLSDTYIFAVSIIKRGNSNEGIVNHHRIYTDSQGTLKILSDDGKKYQPIPLMGFRSCFDKILKLETDLCKPVPCSEFMKLSSNKVGNETSAEGYFNIEIN